MHAANIEFLADVDTDFGTLSLRRRALLSRPGIVVTEIMLDHELLMSSYVTDSERALARIACELHEGESLRVLVGGLGLGYTARQVAESSRVERIEVVEVSAAVIEWMRSGLLPLSPELNADPRVEFVRGDVYARLARAPNPAGARFDLILIDVDHSPSERLAESGGDAFYTAAGLRAAKRHLAPGGLLGVWSYATNSPFADALHESFREVRIEAVTFFNDLVEAESTDWLFFARD